MSGEFNLRKILDIGEVVRVTRLPPSTLRFYEEKGLIRSTSRSGLRRCFDSSVLRKIEFIALGQKAGLTLAEIAAMFAADGRLKIDRKLLLVKAEKIEQNIRQLGAIVKTLQHVANCSAANHLDCPKFQRLVILAGRKQTNVRIKPILKPKKLKRNAGQN